MKLLKLSFALFIFFFLSCSNKTKYIYLDSGLSLINKKKNIDSDILKNWFVKDILLDTIPGISLEKVVENLNSNNNPEKITVALIDTEVDFRHKDLEDKIWKNNNEIPNNNKDDDQNGYIDDINGWNFIGNSKGENIEYANFECTRFIKKFDSIFLDKKIEEINKNQLVDFIEYSKAKEFYNKELENSKFYIEQGEKIFKTYKLAHEKLSPYFPKKGYSVNKLDSLGQKNPEMLSYTSLISKSIKYNVSEQDIINDIIEYKNYINKYLNVQYNDRKILKDNPSNLNDKNYGNNKILKETYSLNHGTMMAGIIGCDLNMAKDKNLAKIKIMPLSISPKGDEHDKDISLAIRYAVDNGAKIINMSSGKQFSLHKKWVIEALKYANKKDVLFITSAGNDNSNINFKSYSTYPNDGVNGNGEIINNFIMVGNSTIDIENLKEYSSNYSKENVDLFAPGTEIYTTSKNNNYELTTGSSASAAIVSKIASLIRSYYPNLKAKEVKEILMKSGVSYNIDVEIKQEDGTKKLVPFSQLSKSGKVVNAYNALVLAEQISKAKK